MNTQPTAQPPATFTPCSWSVSVKYLPATNYMGSRFKVKRCDKDSNGKTESLTVSFDYSSNNPEDVALCAFVEKYKTKFAFIYGQKWAKGQAPNGEYIYSVIF